MRSISLVMLSMCLTATSESQEAVLPARARIVQQLEARWNASSEYTLAIAEQMPADGYAFRPTAEQMTFGEQLLHISQQNRSIFSEMSGQTAPPAARTSPAKIDVVAHLRETHALGVRTLRQRTSGNIDDLLDGMMLALDHTTHHRGQAVVYLRLRGITPSEYRR